MLNNIRKRYKTDIDEAWVNERLAKGVCEVSGIPFVYEKPRHPLSPSIDRIDRAQGGHMKDNCQMILWGLNAFKGIVPQAEFLDVLRTVSNAIVNKG